MTDASYIVFDVENVESRRIKLVDNGDGTYSHDTGSSTTAGNPAAGYGTNQIEEGTTYTYVGLTDQDAAWYVKRITTDGTSITHATITNNAGVASYSAAWTARASLTYGRFDEAF